MQKTINPHLELGRINTLRVDRWTPHGLFIMAQDGKDVLLPASYTTEEMIENTLVDVFLYTDSEDRLIATTLTPKALLDEVAVFEVVDSAKFGVFLDWGLPKDLLLPKKLQRGEPQIGKKVVARVVYDEKTHRLVASQKFGEFRRASVKYLKKGTQVDILVFFKSPLGFKCIVNEEFEGLLYHNELFEHIDVGYSGVAYVKEIRKDGKIDLQLHKKAQESSAQKILDLLQTSKTGLPYNYKSDAKLIKEVFAMSKKEFKRTLTKLQDEGKIEVKETGIFPK